MEWFPVGIEFALGGGAGGGFGYGLVQLSAVVIVGRFEAFATLQWPVGVDIARPKWLSPALFGLRLRFDLAKPRRERVTRVDEGEQTPAPR